MKPSYKYDIFLSYHHEDEEKVRPLYDKMTDVGLRVYWAPKKLALGVSFTRDLEKALLDSQHFLLYGSRGAVTSVWVGKEWEVFLDYHLRDKEHRRMYVVMDPSCSPDRLPELLRDLHRPPSVDDLIMQLFRMSISEQQERIGSLHHQLQEQKRKLEEAQEYYRHIRFWGPIAANRDVHIFVCARNVPHDPNSSRGYGGRTNIDVWDYRAALDITHFFASNYPNTKVTIEDPMTKLQGRDLEQPGLLIEHKKRMKKMLQNKDCIIIGSPDVSDLAEIVLAEIHQIPAYNEERLKTNGFVIIKDHKVTKSSFYWEKMRQEKEGVVEIQDSGQFVYFPHQLAAEGSPGKMYGILVVANNPFCAQGTRRRIVILSGFSGVATNAIAKILTDERCLQEFFKLDIACANTNRDIEALIAVEYVVANLFENRDTRSIRIGDFDDTITFEKLVEIEQLSQRFAVI